MWFGFGGFCFFFLILGLTSLFDTLGPCLSLTRQASSSFLCTGEREKTERDHAHMRETALEQNCVGTSSLVNVH